MYIYTCTGSKPLLPNYSHSPPAKGRPFSDTMGTNTLLLPSAVLTSQTLHLCHSQTPPSLGHNSFKLQAHDKWVRRRCQPFSSDCDFRTGPRAAFLVLRKGANECDKKGRVMEKPGPGRRAEDGAREQTEGKRHELGWQWRTGKGWHILK